MAKKTTKTKKKPEQPDANGLVQMNARIDPDVLAALKASVRPGIKRQHVYQAAARLWTSLPADVQRSLIVAESELQAGGDPPKSFAEIVQEIAESVYDQKQKKKRR